MRPRRRERIAPLLLIFGTSIPIGRTNARLFADNLRENLARVEASGIIEALRVVAGIYVHN
jgi:hypothetical protein